MVFPLLMSKATFKRQLPPCPDPDSYILVTTAEGTFWRRKRGTLTPARINSTLQAQAENMKIASPAARRIMGALALYTEDLKTGRVVAQIRGKCISSLKETGAINLSYLSGIDLQPAHPLRYVLRASVSIHTERLGDKVRIHLSSAGSLPMVRPVKFVESYRFIAVLLQGDAMKEKGLRVTDVVSELYATNAKVKDIVLELPLPKGTANRAVALKVESFEKEGLALLARTRGMQIIQ